MFTGYPGAQPVPTGSFGGSARGRVSAGNKIVAGLAANLIRNTEKGVTTHDLARTLDAVDRIIAGSGTAIDLVYAYNLMRKIDGKAIDSLKKLRSKFSEMMSQKLSNNDSKSDEIKARVVNNLAFRSREPEPPPKKTLKKNNSGLRSINMVNIEGSSPFYVGK